MNAAQLSSVDVQTQKYLTLLELSKAIASHRGLSELFHDIACRLRRRALHREGANDDGNCDTSAWHQNSL